MDMVDFNPIEEGEEEYNLHDFFPVPVPYPLHHLIEYRIKLLLLYSYLVKLKWWTQAVCWEEK